MPIAYLDVTTGVDLGRKKELVKAMYETLHEAWPFPDDTRIFLREWPGECVSQNGRIGEEPFRPVFILHVPQGVKVDVKRQVLKNVNEAVTNTYHLPELMIFMHEHPLDLVARAGDLLADDQQRVEDQRHAYS